MTAEVFQTVREFNKKFPSKYYICSRCKSLTLNPYYCIRCKNQSNNFLYPNYTYTIAETNTTEQIFKPIELEKGVT